MAHGNGDLEDALARAGAVALWMRNPYPQRGEVPMAWRWGELTPLLDRAVAETGMEAAERRVLTLVNPVFGEADRVTTTTNLSANLQILLPGETAREHRHNMNALRFVVEGEGAVTTVDGKDCPMAPGDMILTPADAWHAHANPGSERVVWLDLLDAPLVKALDIVAFERERTDGYPALPADSLYGAGGFLPDNASAPAYSPLFRYPWAEAERLLADVPPAADGSRSIRYVNPVTGGPALGLVDCGLLAPEPGRPTRARRSTANAVAFAVRGAGRSQVGETALDWAAKDVFSLPHGHWISHTASEPGTVLFVGTDREILRRLDLLVDEERDQA